ncbi:Hsp33 family molecular chaperone HslO, partial [Calderihabitans maritimus]|uniref:Hsp33 family molecular chaperone HslO n=1 Tax=Calderihabitans maritimus TaxID=1246530 RepID=UPI000B50B19D
MAMDLKGDDILTIRIMGNGPLGAIVVVANAKGEVKGYVQDPTVHLPPRADKKLDVGGAVGNTGMLYVTKDLGLKEPYTGSVQLVSGEIAEDLAYYFYDSEQRPSSVALGVLVEKDHSVRAAGGLIIQLMPGAQEEIIERLEKNLKNLESVSSLIDQGRKPEELLALTLDGFNIKIHQKQAVKFACNCSRERLEEILLSLGHAELKSMLEEQGQAEVRCHFCNRTYHFSRAEIVQLLKELEEKKGS